MIGHELTEALRRPEHLALPTAVLPPAAHADVRARLADPAWRTPPVAGDPALMRMFSRTLLQLSGERHRRVRARFAERFGPAAMERLRPGVESRARELAEALSPRCDLVPDFARPYPYGVIATVLGVPAGDLPWVHARMDEMRAGGYAAAAVRLLDAFAAMDLAILEGTAAEERDDVVANCVFFIEAGHATITSLVAGSLHLLLTHPDAPRDDVAGVVEEALRLIAPVTGVVRAPVAGGAADYCFLAAANRDPAVFPDPDAYDPGRRPNPHLAFSHGPHFCLGAPLSRLHARVAVEVLLRRHPRLRAAGEPEWSSALPLHELARLPACV